VSVFLSHIAQTTSKEDKRTPERRRVWISNPERQELTYQTVPSPWSPGPYFSHYHPYTAQAAHSVYRFFVFAYSELGTSVNA